MHTSSDPALFWIGLLSVPGVGRTTFRKLVKEFGSPERVLAASREELRAGGLTDRTAAAVSAATWREFAEQELAKARDQGVSIVTADSADYPAALKSAPDHPLLLYIKGRIRREEDGFAVVGTRSPSHYGLSVTERIATELAAAGLTIVSGMARGIDTQAHRGALAARGRTIAVLACGIDVAYPPENRELMEEIAASGAVVAENPFGTRPEAGYFPARNRIISGLSRGTVIIEAAQDSGSLITADYTLEQDRTLFAVPGNIGSPKSKGTNSLIKQGAVLVESAEDILRELGLRGSGKRQAAKRTPTPLSGDEEAVYRCLSAEPRHIDAIMNEAQISAGKLGGVLVTLELKGLVKQLSGKHFVREE